MPRTVPTRATRAAAVVGLLLVGGCTDEGAESSAADLATRLTAARTVLDKAESLQFRLATEALPDGTEGLIEADGVGNHAPAFDGTVTVVAVGLGQVDAELVSVRGDVVAKIGFVREFAPIDPADYGAPDPAAMVSSDGGVSSWLTATTALNAGDQSRDGDLVLTTVSGTLPGAVVQSLIPSADESAGFDVDYRLTDDDVLRDAQITGPFYAGVDDVTYDLTVSASDEPVEIRLPLSMWAPLALAAVAVAFAAADTYVVVLALPDMMAGAGLSSDELQRAAPLVSGFLLGYVGMLPLIGRIADLRGRTPVLVGSLVVFSIGSLVTAAAYDLPTMVTGRLLQGVGAGGLVPATLALVADHWPPERRGLPLGVVGAVQELGAVLGPLFGALVLAVADWRAIFWLNLAVGLLLAAAIARIARPAHSARSAEGGWPDWVGGALAVAAMAVLGILMRQPDALVTDVTLGRAFLPVVGESRWATPLALLGYALAAAFGIRQATARRPLLAWRAWGAVLTRTDLLGALLLAVALGGVVVAFASADPEVAVLADSGPWWLLVAVLGGVAFGLRQRRSTYPLVPRGSLRPRPAWGAVAVSFLVGAALIAALVDIPFFARLTVAGDSQLEAALVLVRFLVALPVGAVLGGLLTRRLAPGPLTAVGMGLAATGFGLMASWNADALTSATSTAPLVLAGLGFGLALAPVNAALLAATDRAVHGVTSALLVVARMVGMLVGISVLTDLGLRRFYALADAIPPVQELCPADPTSCPEYGDRLRAAGLAQLEVVFAGAAVAASLAALLALLVFRGAAARAEHLGTVG